MPGEGNLIIQVAIFPGVIFVLLGVLYLMYFERKLIARIHGRRGPMRTGKFGFLQTPADLMKLLFKEWVFPKTVKIVIFAFAPLILFMLAFLPLGVIPWDPNWYIVDFDVTLIFAFVVVAALPFISLLLGWSSGSKYALMGGYRSASQQIAFEIPLFLSALTPALFAGSLSLLDITEAQANLMYGILNPNAAVIVFISMLAMAERQTFEIHEADSELVFGWKTDLSGIFFGWTIFAGYTIMIAGSALFVTLFLGGFNGPWGPSIGWFMLKLAIIFFIIFVMRASIPRYRMDQLLKMSWKWLIPLGIVSIVLTAVLKYFGIVGVW